MPRTIYLSFLGTNAYIPCNYHKAGGERYENLHFVQEASLRFHVREVERVFIFATELAVSKNWVDNGQDKPEDKYEGLATRLEKLGLAPILEKVDIPDGFVETEIWEIFDRVASKVEAGDRIIFDITHALRYQPMLGMVLLNYLRVLKGIEIVEIYYGAFERLGAGFKVKEIPLMERNAEILSLKSFSTLQEWTNATDLFVNYGSANRLVELTQGSSMEATAIKMKRAMDLFSTVRGKQIISGKELTALKTEFRTLQNEFGKQANEKPFLELLKALEASLDKFGVNSVLNGFQAVRFCMAHELIQQAYTLLLETVISYVLHTLRLPWEERFYRMIVSSCLQIEETKYINQFKPNTHRKFTARDEENLKNRIYTSIFRGQFHSAYRKLSDARNDMLHAGMNYNSMSAQRFIDALPLLYNEIAEVINSYEGNGTLDLMGDLPTFYAYRIKNLEERIIEYERKHRCTYEEYEEKIYEKHAHLPEEDRELEAWLCDLSDLKGYKKRLSNDA